MSWFSCLVSRKNLRGLAEIFEKQTRTSKFTIYRIFVQLTFVYEFSAAFWCERGPSLVRLALRSHPQVDITIRGCHFCLTMMMMQFPYPTRNALQNMGITAETVPGWSRSSLVSARKRKSVPHMLARIVRTVRHPVSFLFTLYMESNRSIVKIAVFGL